MISSRDIDDIIGAQAVDQDNDKIGKVGQVYLDSDSDQPTWVSVKSGLFGTSETLVPLNGADWNDSALHLAFSKDRVKDAPRVEPDAELSPEEQERLYSYYGLADAGPDGADGRGDSVDDGIAGRTDATGQMGTTDRTGSMDRLDTSDGALGAGDRTAADDSTRTGAAGASGAASDDRVDSAGYTADRTGSAGYTADPAGASGYTDDDATAGRHAAGGTGNTGYDTSGPTTDDAMTRSEERLKVGTEQVQTGKARLRKYVVTEQQTVTVPTTHEEVRIEREPITDANRGDALDGPNLSDEEHEVVLTEERPVVNKETVPVERVRLGTEEVTENREVTEDVRHEEIETDGDGTRGATRDRR